MSVERKLESGELTKAMMSSLFSINRMGLKYAVESLVNKNKQINKKSLREKKTFNKPDRQIIRPDYDSAGSELHAECV